MCIWQSSVMHETYMSFRFAAMMWYYLEKVNIPFNGSSILCWIAHMWNVIYQYKSPRIKSWLLFRCWWLPTISQSYTTSAHLHLIEMEIPARLARSSPISCKEALASKFKLGPLCWKLKRFTFGNKSPLFRLQVQYLSDGNTELI